jgi:hypothetical protein
MATRQEQEGVSGKPQTQANEKAPRPRCTHGILIRNEGPIHANDNPPIYSCTRCGEQVHVSWRPATIDITYGTKQAPPPAEPPSSERVAIIGGAGLSSSLIKKLNEAAAPPPQPETIQPGTLRISPQELRECLSFYPPDKSHIQYAETRANLNALLERKLAAPPSDAPAPPAKETPR